MKINKNIETRILHLKRRFDKEPISLVENFYKESRVELIKVRKSYSKSVIDNQMEIVESFKQYLKLRKHEK